GGGQRLPWPGFSAISLAGVLLVHNPFPGLPHLTAHLLDAVGDSPAPSVVTGAIVYALGVGNEGLERDRRCPGGAEFVANLHLCARERGFQRLPAHLRVPGRAGVHIVGAAVVAAFGEQIPGEKPRANLPTAIRCHRVSPPRLCLGFALERRGGRFLPGPGFTVPSLAGVFSNRAHLLRHPARRTK